MDPIVTALAAGSTSEPHFDDQDGDTDDEVAQHTDGASEGEQYDQSSEPDFTITEYKQLHRAVFSPTAGPEELKQLLEKGIDVDCTDHAGRAHSGPNWHHAVPADAQWVTLTLT